MNNNKHTENQMIHNIADRVAEKTLKEDFPAETRRTLRLIRQHDLVGAIINQAMERGEFKNLEGTGQPLNLEENPFAPAELHMVHKILKDNGYAPYWIELGKEIDSLWKKFSKEVDNFRRYTQIVFSEKRSSLAIQRYEQKKNDFYLQSREHLEEISKKILDYNLHCPVSTLGRANFHVDDTINTVISEIEDLIKS
ncbi:MAG: DnaJ family domain-containing protein [Syntrophomonas sp.]